MAKFGMGLTFHYNQGERLCGNNSFSSISSFLMATITEKNLRVVHDQIGRDGVQCQVCAKWWLYMWFKSCLQRNNSLGRKTNILKENNNNSWCLLCVHCVPGTGRELQAYYSWSFNNPSTLGHYYFWLIKETKFREVKQLAQNYTATSRIKPGLSKTSEAQAFPSIQYCILPHTHFLSLSPSLSTLSPTPFTLTRDGKVLYEWLQGRVNMKRCIKSPPLQPDFLGMKGPQSP